jgi:hypothetical protein
MKKKLIYVFITVTIVMAAGWNVMQSQSDEALSDVVLENVEALADETSEKGTLMGNTEGTRFCCCPGTNSCGSASCSGCS